MTDRELFERAREAQKRAYVPYSKFKVGACLLSSDGRVFDGCNIENASYGVTICAERCAICNAVNQGATRFIAVAVVGGSAFAWPCGACRQVLNEFSDDMRVICGSDATGELRIAKLSELLPHSFGPDDLDHK